MCPCYSILDLVIGSDMTLVKGLSANRIHGNRIVKFGRRNIKGIRGRRERSPLVGWGERGKGMNGKVCHHKEILSDEI